MDKYNLEKKAQLGMDAGTASGQLKKKILFQLIKESGRDICYRCQKLINSEEDLTVDHKVPWLHSADPKKLFFDLENIAYSHYKCNVGAARKLSPRTDWKHGTIDGYKTYRCRCDLCKKATKLYMQEWRSRKK